MPTEHEYKYIIDLSITKKFTHEDVRSMSDGFAKIKQGYLPSGKGMTRIRCQTMFGESKWFFTYKLKIDNRVIEIETPIDHRDGKDLWEVCNKKLKKTRYFFDNKGTTWEFDLFKFKSNLYFALAEVELPEGSSRPKLVPSFLKEFILLEVPLTDNRFSNKKLGNVEYATELYSIIKEKS